MKKYKGLFILSVLIIQLNIVNAQNQSGYHITGTFHIASTGGWDYITVDTGSNKLYQSHSTQVNILDKITGDSIGIIPNTSGVHGIALDDALGKGYASNGKINNVTVFDLKTDTILNHVSTGQNPDAIFYDAFSKQIITCNGLSKDLSIIDPVTDKVVATIPVSGKPETAVSDNAGKVYVNIEDKSEIAVVDILANKVIDYWSIKPGESPTGLAIDVKTKRLFSGCGNRLLIIINADDGKIIDTLPIGKRCDGVGFDSNLKYVFASCGEGSLTIIREVSKNEFKVIDTITTKKGARTIAVDQKTHHVYLPTADFEPIPLNATENTRPTIIPGTFQILALEK